jgi:hypothetical protein
MTLNPLSDVRPTGLATGTDVMLFIIPPKLKAAEGIVFMVSDT